MATSKKTAAPAPPKEVAWTIRMPADVADKIREVAEALTAKAGGAKWTGNAVAVRALRIGLAALERGDE